MPYNKEDADRVILEGITKAAFDDEYEKISNEILKKEQEEKE